jgi:hypothetical protein
MLLKGLIGLVFAGALACTATAADIAIRIGPPHAVRERRPPQPSRDRVWVNGYHRRDHDAYAWTPGRWEQPPRPHSRWVAHRWTHTRNGWVMVEGHWR